MNIFYTDENPSIAASNLCRVHINKMIIESAQLLSTAHRGIDGSVDNRLYKITHLNHPSNIWVRQSRQHYIWLLAHMASMMTLYTKVSGKVHAVEDRCLKTLSSVPRGMVNNNWEEPPFCAIERFREEIGVVNDVKQDYKNYLAWKYKEWQNRDKPIKVEFVK